MWVLKSNILYVPGMSEIIAKIAAGLDLAATVTAQPARGGIHDHDFYWSLQYLQSHVNSFVNESTP